MSLVGGPALGDYGHWINELLKEQVEFVVLTSSLSYFFNQKEHTTHTNTPVLCHVTRIRVYYVNMVLDIYD